MLIELYVMEYLDTCYIIPEAILLYSWCLEVNMKYRTSCMR